jgi:hypothetical protein
MPRPSARISVPESSSRHAGEFQQRQDGARPGGLGIRLAIGGRHAPGGLGIRQRRQVVDLVDDDQVAGPGELREVQVGRGGDGLVGGDVAREAPARVGRVLGGAHREAVAERLAPARVGEGLLGLQAQAVARHDPADAVHHAGLDEPGGGDDRQQALAAAGRDGGQDVAHARRLAEAMACTTPATRRWWVRRGRGTRRSLAGRTPEVNPLSYWNHDGSTGAPHSRAPHAAPRQARPKSKAGLPPALRMAPAERHPSSWNYVPDW